MLAQGMMLDNAKRSMLDSFSEGKYKLKIFKEERLCLTQK